MNRKRKKNPSKQQAAQAYGTVRNLASNKLYDDSPESFYSAVKVGHVLVHLLWFFVILIFGTWGIPNPYGPWAWGIGVSIMLSFSTLCLHFYKQKANYLEGAALIGALTGLFSSWAMLFFYYVECAEGNLGLFIPALLMGACWYIGIIGGVMWMLYCVRYKPPVGNYIPPNAGLIGFLIIAIGITLKQVWGMEALEGTKMGYICLVGACCLGLGAYGIPDYLFMRKERLAAETKSKEVEEEKTQ